MADHRHNILFLLNMFQKTAFLMGFPASIGKEKMKKISPPLFTAESSW